MASLEKCHTRYRVAQSMSPSTEFDRLRMDTNLVLNTYMSLLGPYRIQFVGTRGINEEKRFWCNNKIAKPCPFLRCSAQK
jgi:hypothetical protein